jgi:hypothetical protein
MKVYAFDLLPWPHLAEPSYYPDANALGISEPSAAPSGCRTDLVSMAADF